MADTGISRRFNVRVPVRDGSTLSADLTLPAPGPSAGAVSRRWPAVIMRTPYGKSGEPQARRAAVFARGGYAFVALDVRGRGDSDGSFEPYRHDGPDGADVIAWAAAQDWCTGDVATYGASYGGRIQWLTALQRPPALRAMVCLVTPSDPFVEAPTGVPWPMQVNWQRLTDGRMPQYTDDVDWAAVFRHRPLVTMDEAAGFISPNWRAELRHPTLDDWWEPVRYQHRIGEIDVPVLHVSGWYDDEEIGTPANFAAMTAAGRAGQRLLMGGWGHRVNSTRTLGEVDFGPDALIDLDGYVLAFLNEHVRKIKADAGPGRNEDEDAGPARRDGAPVRIFVMGANEWRDEQTWPPAAGGSAVFHFASGGRANSRFGDGRLVPAPVPDDQSPDDQPPDEWTPDEWTHDPDRPVPFITDASHAQIGGPDDYSGVESRGDVLVYTSDPLEEPLELIGAVRVVAYVATSAADTDITAKLVDVHPNGFAQRLCDGVVRLRYRNGCGRREPVTPGEVYEVTIALWDTCVRLPAGHRVRAEIASSAFPKFDVNLGTGGDMITEIDGVLATNRLWHTPSRPSRLLVN